MNRRAFLSATALAGSTLPGCRRILELINPTLAPGAIDVHAHIFNARDVPVLGFLNQVILRDPHTPPDASIVQTAFLRLLKSVMTVGTPTPQEELDTLEAGAPRRAPETLVVEDQGALAAGLRSFTEESRDALASLSETGEQDVINRLFTETGVSRGLAGLSEDEAVADEVAARVYERSAAADTDEYVRRSDFLQTLRWAALLSRARSDILTELVRLYGGDGQIRAFSPSIVDFEMWFRDREDVSLPEDLIKVMARIAKDRTDTVILNFAPFCPLRAALDREAGRDPLRHVRNAVGSMGFVGVKLYPPVGFRPLGNADIDLSTAKARPKGGAVTLDDELRALYAWCVAEEVPLKAHANNSIDAGVCTGLYASPANWIPVLEEFPGLHVNLSHFGGFDESEEGGSQCSPDDPRDWETILADMLSRFEGLYFDISFWTEAADTASDDRARILERMAGLIAAEPLVTDRMLYGSDWSMIGRIPGHEAYLAGVRQALSEDLQLDEEVVEGIDGANAARFMKLSPGTVPHARLSGYFGADHPFAEVFGT